MIECAELRKLKERVGMAVNAYRILAEDPRYVRMVTGLTNAQISDAIMRAEASRQAACAALLRHVAGHRCSSAECQWSGRECGFCEASNWFRAAS